MIISKHCLPLVLAGVMQIGAGVAQAHEYLEANFMIIHPWSEVAEVGDSDVVMGLKITEVQGPDRLMGASTPLAGGIELIPAPGSKEGENGFAIVPGEELELDFEVGHFLLHDVKQDLHWGRQYPLTLVFEKAGAVDVDFVVGED